MQDFVVHYSDLLQHKGATLGVRRKDREKPKRRKLPEIRERRMTAIATKDQQLYFCSHQVLYTHSGIIMASENANYVWEQSTWEV